MAETKDGIVNEKLAQIAQRIRGTRDDLGITVDEMAQVTGTTADQYLLCEDGKADFSFTFLHKCAVRFGIDLSELVTGDVPKLSHYSIVRAGDGMPIERRSGFQYLHLAYLVKHRLAEPFLVTAPFLQEEQDKEIALSTHAGQEFDFVLTGDMKFRYEDKIHILHAGDCVFYDSTKGHGMIACGQDSCKFLAVVIPEPKKK